MGFYFLLVAILSLPLLYSLDPDFGWHIRLGQSMLEQKALISQLVGYQPFFAHYPLVDHEWLANILLYLIYHYLGYFPLVLLSLLLLLGTLYFLRLYIRRIDKNTEEWAIQLTALIFLAGVSLSYGVRLQVILLFGLALLRWITTFPALAKRRIWYFSFFILGVNLHGGVPMLALIPALFEAEPLLLDLKARKKLAGGKLKSYLLTMLIIFSALSLQADGLNYWRLLLQYIRLTSLMSVNISEWTSTFTYPVHWITVMLPLALSVFLLSQQRAWKRMGLSECLLLLYFTWMGTRHIRFYPYLLLLLAPHLAQAWQGFFADLNLKKREVRRIVSLLTVGWLVWALLRINYPFIQWPIRPQQATGYPQAALETLRSYPQAGSHLLHPYRWGGYMSGFYPDIPVFIDGRGPIGPNLFIFNEYQKFYSTGTAEEIGSRLQQYGIQAVLLEKQSPPPGSRLDRWLFGVDRQQLVITEGGGLRQYVEQHSVWKKVFEDQISLLYIRANP